jgi:hypothetical protein
MTPEQKREQLLKRALPALFITVIYFVFVSGFMTEEKEKAEKKYIALAQQGLAPESVKSKNRQVDALQQQLARLKQKKQKLQASIQQMAGFLVADTSSNATATRVSKILADHQVVVIKESAESLPVESLSRSIRDIKSWMQPSQSIDVQQMELRGHYLALYHALQEIKQQKLPLLPVYFHMSTTENNPGLLWQLALWM